LYLVYRMVIKVLQTMQQPPQEKQDSD